MFVFSFYFYFYFFHPCCAQLERVNSHDVAHRVVPLLFSRLFADFFFVPRFPFFSRFLPPSHPCKSNRARRTDKSTCTYEHAGRLMERQFASHVCESRFCDGFVCDRGNAFRGNGLCYETSLRAHRARLLEVAGGGKKIK